MATYLRDSWTDRTLAVKTFLSEAQKIPFVGHTFTGDDHLAGPTAPQKAKIIGPAGRVEGLFVPGSSGAAYRLSDNWHQDMQAMQNTFHYKAYKYSLLATRILTGALSPLQVGICVGSAALPLIDARFPSASEAARNTLIAAGIVADPFGFAAGTAVLVAVRLAMENAADDRRAFWQCMTFVLTRQLSSHAPGYILNSA